MIPHRSSIGVGNIDTNMEYLSDFFFQHQDLLILNQK